MRDEILRAYSLIDFMDILQEECAELIRACSKYKRCTGHGFKTEANIIDTVDNIVEEIADVESALNAIKQLMNIDEDAINKIIDEKDDRSIKRLSEGKENNG